MAITATSESPRPPEGPSPSVSNSPNSSISFGIYSSHIPPKRFHTVPAEKVDYFRVEDIPYPAPNEIGIRRLVDVAIRTRQSSLEQAPRIL